MEDPYAWPAITADTLRAGLAATRTADDKAALNRAITEVEAIHEAVEHARELAERDREWWT